MSRKEIKASRRLQLIEANISCISKLGLSDTTIADVAKAADMSRGIVNFYFESKEKMMRETLTHLAQEYLTVLDQTADVPDRLKALIDAHFAQPLATAKRLGVWMAFVAHAASHGAYRTILADAQAKAEEKLAAAHAPRPGELLALIHGLWLQSLLTPDHAAKAAMAVQCLEFARGGSTPAPRVARAGKRQAEVLPMFDLFAENA